MKLSKISFIICFGFSSIQSSLGSSVWTPLNITRGVAVATTVWTTVRAILKNDLAWCCPPLERCLGSRRGMLCCGLQNVLDSGFTTLAGVIADCVALICDASSSNDKSAAYIAYGFGIATHGAQMLFDLFKISRHWCCRNSRCCEYYPEEILVHRLHCKCCRRNFLKILLKRRDHLIRTKDGTEEAIGLLDDRINVLQNDEAHP